MTKLEWQTGDVGMDDDGMDGCYINAFLFIDISSTPPKKDADTSIPTEL